MLSNNTLIEFTKDITIAKISNSNISMSEDGAKTVASFMQIIYDKLLELNND